MPLLFPLAIFLVMCIVLLFALAHTPAPSATDTVEALCDAIVRNDVKTQKSLMSLESVSSTIYRALGEMAEEHHETAMSYGCTIDKEWDDSSSSYARVAVPLPGIDEQIFFTCCRVTNQWTITGIALASPRVGRD